MISRFANHKFLFQLFVFFLPTQLTYHYFLESSYVFGIRIDYLAWVVYFSDFVFMAFFLLWLKKLHNRKYILSHWKWASLVIFLAVINIARSLAPAICLYHWARVGQYLLLYLYVRKSLGTIDIIKMPIALALFYTAAISVAQIINGGSIGGILYLIGERSVRQSGAGIALMSIFGNEHLRPYATFPHPNVVAGFSLVIFFLFYRLNTKSGNIIKILCLFLVAISYSQNAWLALFLTPVVCYVVSKTKSTINGFILSATVSSFFLPIMRAPIVIPKEIVQRIELAASAGKIISDYPILGVGLGLFVGALPKVGQNSSILWLQPVHNIFLLIASEVGIIGLVLFVYFIQRNTNKSNLYAIVSIVFLSMLDHYFISIHQTALLFAIVLGYNGRDENLLRRGIKG